MLSSSPITIARNGKVDARKTGFIIEIGGPMGAGKSERAVTLANQFYWKYKHIVKKLTGSYSSCMSRDDYVLAITTCEDTKRLSEYKASKPGIHTRDGAYLPGFFTKKVDELGSLFEDDSFKAALSKCEVVIIDEMCFFNDLIEINLKLKEMNKIVINSGLLSNHKKMPFGKGMELMLLADEYIDLKSMCACGGCTNLTRHTAKISGDLTKSVEVGDVGDMYEPRCHTHFPKNKKQ